MGHKRKKKTYRLVWPEDHESHGLVVRIRSLSMREMLNLRRPDEDSDLTDDSAVALFASKLVSWNLEDEDTGEPVPPTLDGVLDQDNDFVLEMIGAWTAAAAGVSPPLGGSSTGGEPSLEASMPMVPLPENRAS